MYPHIQREMSYKDSIGVRNYRPGIEVFKQDQAVNTTVVLYTVPTDRTLWLESIHLQVHSAASRGNGSIIITDASDVLVSNIFVLRPAANDCAVSNITLNTPKEIQTGYKLKIVSDNADTVSRGFIYGYEVKTI